MSHFCNSAVNIHSVVRLTTTLKGIQFPDCEMLRKEAGRTTEPSRKTGHPIQGSPNAELWPIAQEVRKAASLKRLGTAANKASKIIPILQMRKTEADWEQIAGG